MKRLFKGGIAGQSVRSSVQFTLLLVALAGLFAASDLAAQTGKADLRLQILDEDGQPVARVEVDVRVGGALAQTLFSDATGALDLSDLPAGSVFVTLAKPGFFRIQDREIDLSAGNNDVSITLNHETEIEQQLDVQSTPLQIDPDTTSHQESLLQNEILNTPVPSSHNLQQSLITMPQVLQDSSNTLHIAGGRQDQTEVLLDGFEINDPATGGFTSTVNVDAVRDVSVQTGGFGSEYAHAGAGLMSVNTQSGDDRWRFGITNFIPAPVFQQGVHFGNWYPRVTFSGPIQKGRAWFSESFTIEHTFQIISGLPTGQNIYESWSGNNLVRAQWNIVPRNTLYANLLVNLLSTPRQGLGPLSPVSTTLDDQTHRYIGSLKDQFLFGRTLFEVGIAVDTQSVITTPQGDAPYVVTPSMATGNYFQALTQDSRRLQSIGNVTSGDRKWLGSHTLSAGWNADGLDLTQTAVRSEIQYLRADGTLTEQATFSGPGVLHVANTQLGAYAQDLWRPWKPVVISLGVRTDWDRLVQKHLVEPRIAASWAPADAKYKLTLAWGEHYEPLNLALLGMGYDQSRTNVLYDPTGTTPLGPPVMTSFLVPLRTLLQPRSYNTTVEWDQKVRASSYLGASFLLRNSRDGMAWQLLPEQAGLNDTDESNLDLENGRNDRYIAGEFWWRQLIGSNAEVRIDYTRSSATSNQVLDPTLAQLLLAAQQPGPLLWDAPNRVVASGYSPIPVWGLLLSGLLEYHTGFPFSVINDEQQLVGAANAMRFPSYFSLNLALEKRFRFRGHEWAFQVSAINITGSANPNTVVNDIGAPNFLAFSGGQARAFTTRLRLVTQH